MATRWDVVPKDEQGRVWFETDAPELRPRTPGGASGGMPKRRIYFDRSSLSPAQIAWLDRPIPADLAADPNFGHETSRRLPTRSVERAIAAGPQPSPQRRPRPSGTPRRMKLRSRPTSAGRRSRATPSRCRISRTLRCVRSGCGSCARCPSRATFQRRSPALSEGSAASSPRRPQERSQLPHLSGLSHPWLASGLPG